MRTAGSGEQIILNRVVKLIFNKKVWHLRKNLRGGKEENCTNLWDSGPGRDKSQNEVLMHLPL